MSIYKGYTSTYDIIYNGKNLATTQGWYVTTPPELPVPVPKVNKLDPTYSDGSIYQYSDTYEDIEIRVEFNSIVDSYSSYMFLENRLSNTFRFNTPSYSKLRLQSMTDYYYKVKYVEVSNLTLTNGKLVTFEVTFICDPYRYLDNGEDEVNLRSANSTGTTTISYTNDYFVCKPLYRLTQYSDWPGSGSEGHAEITINNSLVQLDLPKYTDPIYIDSDLGICYKGNYLYNWWMIGWYTDMWFKNGSNSIKIYCQYKLKVDIVPRLKTM